MLQLQCSVFLLCNVQEFKFKICGNVQEFKFKVCNKSYAMYVYIIVHTQTNNIMKDLRPLNVIAQEIKKDWTKVYFGAVPYLDAMQTLNSIEDNYYADSGTSIVAYFLSNASTWRGEKAREIKKELNAMLK